MYGSEESGDQFDHVHTRLDEMGVPHVMLHDPGRTFALSRSLHCL